MQGVFFYAGSMSDFLLIGYGTMGKALSARWAGGYGVVNPTRPKGLPRGVSYSASIAAVKTTPEAVLLAVKPQQMMEALRACKARFGVRPLYISIAAGVTLQALEKSLGRGARTIRAMPNTPAMVGEAVTVLIANRRTNLKERAFTDALFDASGITLWLEDESLMNAVTAISGSGPAYQFYVMECLIAAAEQLGLSRVQAETLVVATCKGACTLAAQSAVPLTTLRQQVTSKGGTTEAAMAVLTGSKGIKPPIANAVKAAAHRAADLALTP